MKTSNSSSIISDKNKIKDAYNNSSKGITMKLIEKYKPKDLYNINNLHNKKD